MKKANLYAISLICCIMLILNLAGCESIKEKSVISRNHPTTISKTNDIHISDSAYAAVTVIPTKPDSSPSWKNTNEIDYNQYLKKIWVLKSWNGGAYDYFSFFISLIENGIAEGKFSIGQIAYPDFYYYSLDPLKYLGDLSGMVNNGVAECQFSDKVGNKGNVTLLFKENDRIEAKIEYTDKGEAYNDVSLDGSYLFRPYNLADINDFLPIQNLSLTTELNSWGSVNFVPGKVNHGDKVYPAVYLTNEQGDILYKFQAPFQTGSEIIEDSIEDLNNDGLKDVSITTDFIDAPGVERKEWTLYPMNNGLFYDSELSTD